MAVGEREASGEREAAFGAVQRQDDAARLIRDEMAVDVFVVCDSEWPDCRAQLHESDVRAFGETFDRRYVDRQRAAERWWRRLQNTVEDAFGKQRRIRVEKEQKSNFAVLKRREVDRRQRFLIDAFAP